MKRRVHGHEKTGELNIVPYLDIMVNLTMFMLVSMTSVIQFGILNVAAPNYGPATAAQQSPGDEKKKELLLSVAISTKGFYIAGSGGVLGGGDKSAPPDPKNAPPTVPQLPDGKYDYLTLTKKMVDIKNSFPAETKIILMADQAVPYEVLVATMDAVRDDGAEPSARKLFYDIVLGAL
jgi:biopolymer transport protein TolR